MESRKLLKSIALSALAFLSVSLLANCCIISGSKPPSTDLIGTIRDETVALVEFDNDTQRVRSYCTGTWVADNKILTASHCVATAGEPLERQILRKLDPKMAEWDPVGHEVLYSCRTDLGSPDESRFYRHAKVLSFDTVDDLALVEVDKWGSPSNHPVATISHDQIREGDVLHIVGHPKGIWWTYLKGYVAAFRQNMETPTGRTDVIQVEAPIWFGDSGASAFDANGHIVGVVSFLMRNLPGEGFIIHRDAVGSFLQRNGV